MREKVTKIVPQAIPGNKGAGRRAKQRRRKKKNYAPIHSDNAVLPRLMAKGNRALLNIIGGL